MLAALVAFAALAASPLPPGNGVLAPPKHGGIYVVSHRGWHEEAPENTIAAYRKGAELGVDFVEIDTRELRDGAIISMHNANVDAYTKDAKGPVKQFTLDEVKKFDIGGRIGPQWKNERVPTFDEILDTVKGKCGIYLDLKDAPVSKLLEIIRKHGMEKQVIWYASPAQEKQVKKECPECNPMPDPGPEAFLKMVLKDHQPKIIASDAGQFTASFAQTCHEAGAIVIVDDKGPESWDKLLADGADGIQTDRPAKLIEYLEQRAAKK